MLFTGIDLTEIERIKKSCQNPRFIARVFSAKEQEYLTRDLVYPSMAAAFAAKEAFSKALGTGIRGFELNEVSVEHDPLGAPFFYFYRTCRRNCPAEEAVLFPVADPYRYCRGSLCRRCRNQSGYKPNHQITLSERRQLWPNSERCSANRTAPVPSR